MPHLSVSQNFRQNKDASPRSVYAPRCSCTADAVCLLMNYPALKEGGVVHSLTHNQAALEIFREIGDRANEAEALKNLAEVHQALGERVAARQHGEQALVLATELGIPLKAECEALLQQIETGEGACEI